MRLEACALLLYRGNAWDSLVEDISASGILVRRPPGWAADKDASLHLELILDAGGTIAVHGRVARLTNKDIGIEFTHIPAWSQAPLWNLLGDFADSTEAMA
jgi:hypothetical protein